MAGGTTTATRAGLQRSNSLTRQRAKAWPPTSPSQQQQTPPQRQRQSKPVKKQPQQTPQRSAKEELSKTSSIINVWQDRCLQTKKANSQSRKNAYWRKKRSDPKVNFRDKEKDIQKIGIYYAEDDINEEGDEIPVYHDVFVEEVEYDPEEAVFTMKNEDFETEDHDQTPWFEEEYEELPWWEYPDLEEEDEITALCLQAMRENRMNSSFGSQGSDSGGRKFRRTSNPSITSQQQQIHDDYWEHKHAARVEALVVCFVLKLVNRAAYTRLQKAQTQSAVDGMIDVDLSSTHNTAETPAKKKPKTGLVDAEAEPKKPAPKKTREEEEMDRQKRMQELLAAPINTSPTSETEGNEVVKKITKEDIARMPALNLDPRSRKQKQPAKRVKSGGNNSVLDDDNVSIHSAAMSTGFYQRLNIHNSEMKRYQKSHHPRRSRQGGRASRRDWDDNNTVMVGASESRGAGLMMRRGSGGGGSVGNHDDMKSVSSFQSSPALMEYSKTTQSWFNQKKKKKEPKQVFRLTTSATSTFVPDALPPFDPDSQPGKGKKKKKKKKKKGQGRLDFFFTKEELRTDNDDGAIFDIIEEDNHGENDASPSNSQDNQHATGGGRGVLPASEEEPDLFPDDGSENFKPDDGSSNYMQDSQGSMNMTGSDSNFLDDESSNVMRDESNGSNVLHESQGSMVGNGENFRADDSSSNIGQESQGSLVKSINNCGPAGDDSSRTLDESQRSFVHNGSGKRISHADNNSSNIVANGRSPNNIETQKSESKTAAPASPAQPAGRIQTTRTNFNNSAPSSLALEGSFSSLKKEAESKQPSVTSGADSQSLNSASVTSSKPSKSSSKKGTAKKRLIRRASGSGLGFGVQLGIGQQTSKPGVEALSKAVKTEEDSAVASKSKAVKPKKRHPLMTRRASFSELQLRKSMDPVASTDSEQQKATDDPKFRMVMLRHAAMCSLTQKGGVCPSDPKCSQMKELLRHMTFCKHVSTTVPCSFPGCHESKSFLLVMHKASQILARQQEFEKHLPPVVTIPVHVPGYDKRTQNPGDDSDDISDIASFGSAGQADEGSSDKEDNQRQSAQPSKLNNITPGSQKGKVHRTQSWKGNTNVAAKKTPSQSTTNNMDTSTRSEQIGKSETPDMLKGRLKRAQSWKGVTSTPARRASALPYSSQKSGVRTKVQAVLKGTVQRAQSWKANRNAPTQKRLAQSSDMDTSTRSEQMSSSVAQKGRIQKAQSWKEKRNAPTQKKLAGPPDLSNMDISSKSEQERSSITAQKGAKERMQRRPTWKGSVEIKTQRPISDKALAEKIKKEEEERKKSQEDIRKRHEEVKARIQRAKQANDAKTQEKENPSEQKKAREKRLEAEREKLQQIRALQSRQAAEAEARQKKLKQDLDDAKARAAASNAALQRDQEKMKAEDELRQKQDEIMARAEQSAREKEETKVAKPVSSFRRKTVRRKSLPSNSNRSSLLPMQPVKRLSATAEFMNTVNSTKDMVKAMEEKNKARKLKELAEKKKRLEQEAAVAKAREEKLAQRIREDKAQEAAMASEIARKQDELTSDFVTMSEKVYAGYEDVKPELERIKAAKAAKKMKKEKRRASMAAAKI